MDSTTWTLQRGVTVTVPDGAVIRVTGAPVAVSVASGGEMAKIAVTADSPPKKQRTHEAE